jgi:hypothetical protein
MAVDVSAEFDGIADGAGLAVPPPDEAQPVRANIAANVVTAMDENFLVLVIVVMTVSLSYLVPYLRKVFGLSLFSCWNAIRS